MASNTQIVANLHRRKRPAKKLWLGIAAAALLVTLPVLPLRFLGIPGPDLDWHQLELLTRSMFGKLTGETPSRSNQEKTGETPARIGRTDIKLVDVTITSLLKEISERPNDPSLHNRVGLIYAEIGEPLVAVTHFEQAIKLCREQIHELKSSSNEAKSSGDVKQAAGYMLQISDLNVQLAAAHSSLARVYEQLGKSDKVMSQLNELGKDISLSKVIDPGAALSDRTRASLAAARSADNRLDADTAALLARADALRQAGRLFEAQQEYKKLTERLPSLSIGHKELGMTALSMRNLWLAQEELAKAAALNTRDATTHSALATIAKELGQNDKAQLEYEKALLIDPKDVNAAFNLGNLYADDSAYLKAITAYQKAVAARPDFGPAHNNLATMYSFNEQYPEAIREFQQTILLEPNLASAYYGLGIACMHEKRYKESVRAFKRALALNPDLVDAHNKLEAAQKKALAQGRIN